MRAGIPEEAIACYRALLRLEPDKPRAYWRLAMMYEFLGAAGAALEVCRHGLRRLPDAGCLHRQHAHLLLNSGSVQGALRALTEAGELNSAHYDTQHYVGLALRQAGRLEEARQALEGALARRPDDPKLYYALGLCCSAAEVQESVGWVLQGLAAEAACRDLHLGRIEGVEGDGMRAQEGQSAGEAAGKRTGGSFLSALVGE